MRRPVPCRPSSRSAATRSGSAILCNSTASSMWRWLLNGRQRTGPTGNGSSSGPSNVLGASVRCIREAIATLTRIDRSQRAVITSVGQHRCWLVRSFLLGGDSDQGCRAGEYRVWDRDFAQRCPPSLCSKRSRSSMRAVFVDDALEVGRDVTFRRLESPSAYSSYFAWK